MKFIQLNVRLNKNKNKYFLLLKIYACVFEHCKKKNNNNNKTFDVSCLKWGELARTTVLFKSYLGWHTFFLYYYYYYFVVRWHIRAFLFSTVQWYHLNVESSIVEKHLLLVLFIFIFRWLNCIDARIRQGIFERRAFN